MRVSCICVTAKSEHHVENFLPIALECFRCQTHPSLELVVVSDDFHAAVASATTSALEGWPGDVALVSRPKGESLGALRNAGLDAATGDLCIQWDDDDWHHPERIARQVAVYEGHPVMLARQIVVDVQRDVAFVRRSPPIVNNGELVVPFPPIVGTILHANDPDHRYLDVPRHEDTQFALDWGVWTTLQNTEQPELYVRFAHSRSTSGMDHVMGEAARWPWGTWAIPEPCLVTVRRAVDRYRPIM